MSNGVKTVLPEVGSELYQRYKEIMPLLTVIEIRTKENGLDGLYYYDEGRIEQWKFTRKIAYFAGLVLYYINTFFLWCDRKKRCNRILLSDNLLFSSRYKKAVEKMAQSGRVSGLCNSASALASFVDFVSGDSYSRMRDKICDVPLGTMVSDKKLRKCMDAVFYYFCELYKSGQVCACDVRSEKLFGELQTAYQNTLSRLVKRLRKYGVSQYITMNEYSAKDVLIIQAGNSIPGFLTKYYNHNCKYVYHSSKPDINWKVFSKIIYVWDDLDKKYVEDICRFDEAYSNPIVRVAGSPELDEDDVTEMVQKHPKQNRITFLIPASVVFVGVNKECDEYNRQFVHEKKEFIFEQIRLWAQNNNCDVVARHNPNDKKEYTQDDLDICNRCGFEVIDGEALKLHKALCESVAVVTDPSSTLFLANVYGCRGYVIDWEGIADECCIYDGADYITKVMDYEIKNMVINKKYIEAKLNCCFDLESLLE